MESWIACGADFIPADVVRWREPVFDGPFGRNGRKKRGKPVRVGEREVTAEVLSPPDIKGFVILLVRGCRPLSVAIGVKEFPPLKLATEIKRQVKTLVKGQVSRLRWSDETARSSVVDLQPL